MTENTQTERESGEEGGGDRRRESVAKNGTGRREGGVELAWAEALLILCAN